MIYVFRVKVFLKNIKLFCETQLILIHTSFYEPFRSLYFNFNHKFNWFLPKFFLADQQSLKRWNDPTENKLTSEGQKWKNECEIYLISATQ